MKKTLLCMWFCKNSVVRYCQVYRVVVACAVFHSKYNLIILLYNRAVFVQNSKEFNAIFQYASIHTKHEQSLSYVI